jgi:hypothetical protein
VVRPCNIVEGIELRIHASKERVRRGADIFHHSVSDFHGGLWQLELKRLPTAIEIPWLGRDPRIV